MSPRDKPRAAPAAGRARQVRPNFSDEPVFDGADVHDVDQPDFHREPVFEANGTPNAIDVVEPVDPPGPHPVDRGANDASIRMLTARVDSLLGALGALGLRVESLAAAVSTVRAAEIAEEHRTLSGLADAVDELQGAVAALTARAEQMPAQASPVEDPRLDALHAELVRLRRRLPVSAEPGSSAVSVNAIAEAVVQRIATELDDTRAP